MLWNAGAPDGTRFVIDDSVSRDTRVTLSIQNAPFDTALDLFCDSARIRYEIRGDTYYFSPSDGGAPRIIITRVGDRLNWTLRAADPFEALDELLKVFEKARDIDANASPTRELNNLAEMLAKELEAIMQTSGNEQANRLKLLREENERFVKPPKAVRSGAAKSVSVDQSRITFGAAMDTLGEAGGFLWFRASDGRIVVRATTSVEEIRDILQRANVWSALQK